ncbi:hypothetical protein VEx25_1332 [Vibrio antiquarius]|uniref:Uncharacterized protein n=1 Tax=Vibrio antiquarius (strain Ex25) TaxID=150340 RepID=A0ABM9WVS8_VIBAE|nr:hypothetical protein VEx25_1332 [Vibrio antiquarius]
MSRLCSKPKAKILHEPLFSPALFCVSPLTKAVGSNV